MRSKEKGFKVSLPRSNDVLPAVVIELLLFKKPAVRASVASLNPFV
jgi:hypothetical protein